MNRWLKSGSLLLILVCAVAAFRHDRSQWRLIRADRAFHRGDLRVAHAAWSSASVKPSTRQEALFNRGVARYRLGELTAASADFRLAAGSGDSKLRQQALYNLGTTLLVMERERKTTGRQEAEGVLTEAVRHLQAAVDLHQTDTAAGHNKAVAQARLAAVVSEHPKAETPLQPQEKKGQGAATAKQPGQAGPEAGKPGKATDRDAPSGRRRAAPVLSSEQALRMLDEVRGREALRSGVAAGNRHEKMTLPEKDW
jgi:tetratricopeptide (TPR) repeat protein